MILERWIQLGNVRMPLYGYILSRLTEREDLLCTTTHSVDWGLLNRRPFYGLHACISIYRFLYPEDDGSTARASGE